MKLILLISTVMLTSTSAWFLGRNEQTTATADGRAIDDSCVSFGEAGSCQFFDCFEQRLPCGRDYYMQRFGNYYCNRFERYMDTFTEAGQEFIANSQQCVTERLLDHYRRDYVNCHDLEHDAISFITPCYTEHGFCDIIGDNTQQFIEVFEFNDLFRSGSGKLWRELLKLARQCGGRALANFLSSASSRFNPLRNLFGARDNN